MPKIILETKIHAPIGRVFDLARSIDLHKVAATETNEEAISGRTSGLIELYETVTWRAKHLGVYQQLTVEIIVFEKPYLFVDTMLRGPFKSMKHVHKFEYYEETTKMLDEFESPFGIIGNAFNELILKNYMANFLKNRNAVLKEVAEGDKWRALFR